MQACFKKEKNQLLSNVCLPVLTTQLSLPMSLIPPRWVANTTGCKSEIHA